MRTSTVLSLSPQLAFPIRFKKSFIVKPQAQVTVVKVLLYGLEEVLLGGTKRTCDQGAVYEK
jgi:hypothetical protein